MDYLPFNVLCAGATDGGVQHCNSGVETELLWHVWISQKQRVDEWILSRGITIMAHYAARSPIRHLVSLWLLSLTRWRVTGSDRTISKKDRRATTSGAPTSPTSVWPTATRPSVRSWTWSHRPFAQTSWRPSRRRGFCVWDQHKQWSEHKQLTAPVFTSGRQSYLHISHLWKKKSYF